MTISEYFSTRTPNATEIQTPYILAEAGVNHEGDFDLAKRLVNEAAEGGADGIKFQAYKAESLASRHSPAYWDLECEPTTSQFELFKKYDAFGKTEFQILSKLCREVGIDFLSTPFDNESAYYLNDLMDAFKISSSDITNKPFLQYIASFGKPVILSTGASNLLEIEQALQWLNASEPSQVALLHCVLSYPTADEDSNLGMITDLRLRFPKHLVGYSDHTLPQDMKTIEIAALLGASLIEKHFTHDKSLPGNDHYHAMDKEDLKLFRSNWTRTLTLLGSFDKHDLPQEQAARLEARRSLVAARDLSVGHILTLNDLIPKRPGRGISPNHLDEIIGRTLTQSIKQDQLLQYDCLM